MRQVRFQAILPPPVRIAFACLAVGLLLVPAVTWGAPDSPGTTITGVVRDTEGEPISRAFLQIEGWRDRVGATPWTTADASGRFEVRNVPEGAVKLRAVAGNWTLYPKVGKLVETRGGVRDLEVVLETGRELRLKVEAYDPRGLEAIPGARLVWAMEPQAVHDEFRWAPIAADGSVRFVQLPDVASFEVWGRAALDRPFRTSGLVPSRKVQAIRAVAGLTISGRIVPSKVVEENYPDLHAEAYPMFIAAGGVAKSDGTFVIRGLPDGEYTVVCELRGGAREGLQARKTVRAGATGVDLDFSEWVR